MFKKRKFYSLLGLTTAAVLLFSNLSYSSVALAKKTFNSLNATKLVTVSNGFTKEQGVSSSGRVLNKINSNKKISQINTSSLNRATAIPTSYDLRTKSALTPVKDQGQVGSCWTFAAMGATESYLKLTNSSHPDNDFSENNLLTQAGFDFGVNDGGNRDMSAAYLIRWAGPASESDDPYPSGTAYPSDIVNRGAKPAQEHVQNVIYLPPHATATSNDDYKNAVMQYGAVDTSLHYPDYNEGENETDYFNYTKNSLNYTGSNGSNHEICIVGWDDNYPASNFVKKPVGNGAFICKNSWGTGWGDNGYFYVSYYDTQIAKEGTVYESEPTSNYDNVAQYDPLGATSGIYFNNLSKTVYFSNVYTAGNNQNLSAVGFYAEDTGYSYSVYVVTDYAQNGFKNLQLLKSGSLTYAGYDTIKLDNPVKLTSGSKYAVVVKATSINSNPGIIPVEEPSNGYSSLATANAGESFISSDGSNFYDLVADCDFTNTNACVKAYTDTSVAAPTLTITPKGGTYSSSQTIAMTATNNASIYYTTNGSTPTAASTKYTAPITISQTTTLKGIAIDSNGNASLVDTENYIIQTPTAPTLTISPKGGTYSSSQTITMTATNNASIYYTTNGSTPTAASTKYTAPITISQTTTLKGIAIDSNGNASPVDTENYVIQTPTAPTLTISPKGGTYSAPQTITMTATNNASIYYTTNGSTPTAVSTKYTAPITISQTTTLKGIAIDSNGNASPVDTENYIIQTPTAPTLTITPKGGTYSSSQTITMAATNNASIYYTTNGSIPTAASTKYTSPITISQTTTVKGIAIDSNGNASPVDIESYVIQTQPAVVSTSPSNGEKNVPLSKVITVNFNKNVTVDLGSVFFMDMKGRAISAQANLSGNVMTITPSSKFEYGTNYYLFISKDAIKDSDGNSLAGDFLMSFQTLSQPSSQFYRLAGSTRYDTAQSISKAGWSYSEAAILCTANSYPDALSASALSKCLNYAPILLTDSNTLSPQTSNELKRLGVTYVVIIGGTGAVSQGVENTLHSMGIKTDRLAGSTRYETSALIAYNVYEIMAQNGTPVNCAIIATGNGFADALSIASYSAANAVPIILTDTNSISSMAMQVMNVENVNRTFVIGGTGVITDNVKNNLPSPTRLGGANRYETNSVIINYFSAALNLSDVYIATGTNFPDALAGSALAGLTSSPIILTCDSPDQSTINLVKNIKSQVMVKYVIGGTGVLSDKTISNLFN